MVETTGEKIQEGNMNHKEELRFNLIIWLLITLEKYKVSVHITQVQIQT